MLSACITITPEIIAFVVAMAGMIFPAMAKNRRRRILSISSNIDLEIMELVNRKYKIGDSTRLHNNKQQHHE